MTSSAPLPRAAAQHAAPTAVCQGGRGEMRGLFWDGKWIDPWQKKKTGIKLAAMLKVGSLLNYVGGAFGRMAGAGLAFGLFMLFFGMTPGEAAYLIFTDPPAWLMSGWLRIIVLIFGIVLLIGSVRFNIWTNKQTAINELAENLSWAISDLLNRKPPVSTTEDVANWEKDYRDWCNKVSKNLENRAFFSRADQLHFDRLGFIEQVKMSGISRHDWLLGQLKLKFDRLREVINWSQQRPR